MMAMPVVVIIDYLSVAFRWYHAMKENPLVCRRGLNTSPLHGFLSTLLGILEHAETSNVLVCRDCKTEPNFRKLLYPEYKAQRKAVEPDMALALPHLDVLLDNLCIPSVAKPGFEADDLIATYAKRYAAQGYYVLIVSNDKDLLQLVDYCVNQLRQGTDSASAWRIWRPVTVQNHYGFRHPRYVADYLALMGDASDNIPGVPGIGEKAATELVASFGCLEEIYAMLDYVVPKHRKKLVEHRDAAFRCRELTTTRCDVDVPDMLPHWQRPPLHEIKAVLEPYELNMVMRQFEGQRVKDHGFPVLTPPAVAQALAEPVGYLF